MTINQVTRYECSSCKKLYAHSVSHCACENKNREGKVEGPFRLIEKVGGRWKCECILCTGIKEVHVSNLKRQSSCGCLPRHIRLVTITPERVKYHCNKCGKEVSEDLPITQWCHDNNGDV